MKRFFNCIFFMVLVFQSGSCVKSGDISSNNMTPAITDQETAQYLLNGIYGTLAVPSSNEANHSETWVFYHEITPAVMAGLIENISPPIGANSPIVDISDVYTIWSNNYDIINAVNNFINTLNKLPDSKFTTKSKNEMLGEARFLRAYANYQLLTYFGEFYDMNSSYGVLLRKDVINTGDVSVKRSSVADTYTYILTDIDFAMVNAPLNNPNYYVNQWAAKALKARILINRGVSNDYEQVTALTKDIINNGPYSLETNLKDLFYIKGLNSKEVILGIVPQPGQNIQEGAYVTNFATTMLGDLMKNDPRGNWEIKPDSLLYYNGYNGFDIQKYGGNYPEVSYAFRLTEMYLLQAEAITRGNGDLSQAKALLKTVMGHAGSIDFSTVDNAATASQLELLIYQEITKNLFCEDGAEWFSLLRMGFDQVKTSNPMIKNQTQCILPIPVDELEKNNNMVQNPGY
jgi:hypothetical protein